MNLKNMTDENLLINTDALVRNERELLVELLHHLREIERRRLFSALKFESLFKYAVVRLGYPEDQAHRRIAAMRLLKELPELEEKIASGSLNLTNLGLAKTLFTKEKKAGKDFTKAEKLEVIDQLEDKSVREAAKIIAEISPETQAPDRIRPVAAQMIEIKFWAPDSMQTKIFDLKGLLAHSHPHITLAELIDQLCDLGLKEWSKTAAPRDSSRQKSDSQAGIERAVWARDKNCTECGSSFALELDHIRPQAMGGDSSFENLRVLCRSCNQRAAVEAFGAEKMAQFLKCPEARYSVH